MRFIKSIAVSIATALLLMFAVSVFVPFFSNNVNAAGEVIEVQNVTDLKKALGASTSKGKTVRMKNIMYPDSTITISTSLTLDLNYTELRFEQGKNLIINTEDENDVVTIIGQGRIQTNNDSYAINVEKGKLIFDTGCVQNTNSNGYCLNSSSNIMILNGAFMSAHEMGKDIVIPYGLIEEHQYAGNYEYEIYNSTLKVCGTAVTKDNCDDILGNGVFSYDLWTKTFNINGDYEYEPDKKLIQSSVKDLVINVCKPSKLVGWFQLDNDTTITGNNYLELNAADGYSVIWSSKIGNTLTIRDVAIIFDGFNLFSFDDASLVIDDSKIIATTSGGFCFSSSLTLNDCYIVAPSDAVIKDGIVYESDGVAYVTSIVIEPMNAYEPAQYTWSDDYSECTAVKVPKYGSGNSVTETVKTTSKVKIEATTTEKGTTTYTAAFTKIGFAKQTKDVQDIPVKQPDPSTPGTSTPGSSTPGASTPGSSTPAPSTPGPSTPAPSNTSTGGGFEEFVERLYTVALNRASEPEGKAFWCEHVGNGDLDGAQCAKEFLLSKEFNNRGLDDKQFLEVLYMTFFNRDAADDPDGFNFWMESLKTQGRDVVVDCFINSEEWCNVCASYGVRSGATRAKATIASANATAFATRLYTECLGREPEEGGLKFWSLGLTNQELSGSQAAKEFFYSTEFVDAKYSDEEYINRMYKTFMGRDPEAEGKAYWLDLLSNGTSRDEVFNFFSTCPEFTEICQKYAIVR